jgi:hypothetical protein
MTKIEDIDFSKVVRRRMLGLSLDGWNNVMLWCLAVAAIAAISVGVAQYVIIQLAKQEAADSQVALDRYKLTVEGKVADAKTEGIKAGKAAGDALLRAAQLEKEAATARLETEKLKGVVAWRTISSAQDGELIKAWGAQPGSVNLYWQAGDPEALFFAIQLANVLQRANWKVSARSMQPTNGILFDLIVPPVAGTDADSLRNGLVGAKISFSAVHPAAIQGGFSSFGSGMDLPNAPMFIVGSRKPVIP